NLLTLPSGSSNYFLLGIVAYSNRAKTSVLKIPPSLIAKEGAVSRVVASLMAQSVRKIAKTDFGIGITGIAGPGGGTYQEPVGTEFIAIDTAKKKICQRFLFKGNRIQIRKKAAVKALELLSELMCF
ncbi:MAG: CinA family protein, partial [Candidatus Omnitrophica bacterium]|nr:CinA family protein [Candidatus Omnitrophota bacterium]